MDSLLQAAAPLLGAAFTLWGSPVTWAEVLAFVLALAMVGCNIRVNPTGWPLAIASSLIYGVLFWDSRLYGEASLQIVFVLVALWGWWQWLRGTGDDGAALRVRRLSTRSRWLLLGGVLLAWPALGWLLLRTTDTDVPWFDALPTVGSIAGQWLLGRKYVENWPTWVAVNLISIGLFAWKGLWLTTLLYALFALLALIGWRAWTRLADAELKAAR
jgi:nicotinamide mononucleotide transporter